MKILYSPTHLSHIPQFEIFNGEKDPHSEIPARVENIKKSLIQNGYKLDKSMKKIPISLLNQVHRKDYVGFLKNPPDYCYPSVFPYNDVANNKRALKNPLARLGFFSFDLYTPISKKIYEIAFQSASLSFEVADDLINNKITVGYALCRPPGHHAERAKMGGYCYFNNSSIAAQHLTSKGKVAVLDVDFHHGNGTQNIFYERGDVLTISIHADPNWKFPFYTGFTNETGLNEGEGKNINFPMSKGTTNLQYQKILENALKKIQIFNPKYLVVPLGLDTHEKDPIGGFKLTTGYYTTMAKTISSLNLPTAIIQEGGYNTELLGNNVVAFLKGFS